MPVSIWAGGGHFFACAMIVEKSFISPREDPGAQRFRVFCRIRPEGCNLCCRQFPGIGSRTFYYSYSFSFRFTVLTRWYDNKSFFVGMLEKQQNRIILFRTTLSKKKRTKTLDKKKINMLYVLHILLGGNGDMCLLMGQLTKRSANETVTVRIGSFSDASPFRMSCGDRLLRSG